MCRSISNKAVVLFAVFASVLLCESAAAQLTTFRFEAVNDRVPSDFFPVPTGTRAIGTYTFDPSTPRSNTPGSTSFAFYDDAIVGFEMELETFGTASFDPNGIASRILVGDPVQTTGSENFLSDQYNARSPASGLTIFTPNFSGTVSREVIWAEIRLQDIDEESFDTDEIPLTPPSLSTFQDNIIPGQIESDEAELVLNLRSNRDDGTSGTSSTSFRLVSLTLVPEPGTGTMFVLGSVIYLQRRRRVLCRSLIDI